MADETSGKFTLGTQKEVEEVLPPPLPKGESKKRRGYSAGVYLLLAFIVVGMVAAYFDLSRRVNRSQNVGTNQIDNLENRLVILFDKFTALEKQLNQNIAADQEALKEIEAQLKKATEMVTATDKELSAKANQKEIKTTLAALKKEVTQTGTQADESLKSITDLKKGAAEINAIRAGLEKLKASVTTAQAELSGEINEITLQLDQSSKSLIELRSQAARLSTSKIDRDSAVNLIKKQLQVGQPSSQRVSATLSDHQAKITTLKKQIADLKKDANIYVKEILKIKKQLKAGPPAVSGQSSQRPPATGTTVSSSTTPSAKSEDLLQQTLKE